MVLYLKGKDINTLITYQISINKSISYKQNGLRYLVNLTHYGSQRAKNS